MKVTYLLACLGILVVTNVAHADQSSAKVALRGETILVANIGKSKIEVKFKSHEISIGKPSDPRPTEIESNCTYSRYPCSVIDWLGISVDGKPLFVPRSVFADLADLSKAEIGVTKKGWVLMLDGGGASESYIVKIEFDSTRIRSRTLMSGMSPDQVLQKTIYYQEIFGD